MTDTVIIALFSILLLIQVGTLVSNRYGVKLIAGQLKKKIQELQEEKAEMESADRRRRANQALEISAVINAYYGSIRDLSDAVDIMEPIYHAKTTASIDKGVKEKMIASSEKLKNGELGFFKFVKLYNWPVTAIADKKKIIQGGLNQPQKT